MAFVFDAGPCSLGMRQQGALSPVDPRLGPWTQRCPDKRLLNWILALININVRRPAAATLPSVKQSSGSSRSSASSGIFFRISSGSRKSTVLPSEELVSPTAYRAEAQGSQLSSLSGPVSLYVVTAHLTGQEL